MNPMFPPSYPKSLQYAVSKLAGYSTSVVKLRCNQNSAAKAGDVISFDLPYNALVDMDSLRVAFNVRNSGAGTTGLSVVHTELLVRQIFIEAGGQMISSSADNLGVLWNIMNDFQAGDKKTVREIYNGRQAIAAAPVADNSTVTPHFISNLLGFCSSVKPSFVDTSLFPGGSIRVSIRLAPNGACALLGAAAYELTDLTMLARVSDVQDGFYYNVLKSRLASGGIELPFTQIYGFNAGTKAANSTTIFSLSSQSVDLLVGTCVPSAFEDGSYLAAVKGTSYMSRGAGAGSAPVVSWKVNNVQHPAYGTMTAMEAFSETLASLGLLQDTVGAANATMATAALWESHYFASAYRLSHPDGEGRTLSGLNALGTNGVGEFSWAQTGAVASIPLVFVLTTAIVKIGQGRSMAVTY
jgi:hypothetical protein